MWPYSFAFQVPHLLRPHRVGGTIIADSFLYFDNPLYRHAGETFVLSALHDTEINGTGSYRGTARPVFQTHDTELTAHVLVDCFCHGGQVLAVVSPAFHNHLVLIPLIPTGGPIGHNCLTTSTIYDAL